MKRLAVVLLVCVGCSSTTDNAKCPYCNTPAHVPEKYRDSKAGLYKRIQCSECGQSCEAFAWFLEDAPQKDRDVFNKAAEKIKPKLSP